MWEASRFGYYDRSKCFNLPFSHSFLWLLTTQDTYLSQTPQTASFDNGASSPAAL